jgi:hypothetical protein
LFSGISAVNHTYLQISWGLRLFNAAGVQSMDTKFHPGNHIHEWNKLHAVLSKWARRRGEIVRKITQLDEQEDKLSDGLGEIDNSGESESEEES